MPSTLTCSQGHSWQVAGEVRSTVCPFCAEPVTLPAAIQPVRESPPGEPSEDFHTESVDSRTIPGPSALHIPVPGYELVGKIGHGGMGVVWRARDLALDREVALKFLQPQIPAKSSAAARFIEEARITGQLQHPGIPAIYQVGALDNGRPYLAMKLIKGRTLHDLLRDQTEQRNWLAIFESICEAVGYAHAHRVIHRDLKPANVMVGAFGEVQVMDWGLAKVMRNVEGGTRNESEETQPVETEIRTPRADGSDTQAGSVVGTPAFMPPEQAAGEIHRIDRRADVFSLGAILCTILTGKPPYEGANAEAVRVLAVRGKLEDVYARLAHSGAEPELIALAKRCLAFEPADRPSDASAVAAEVAKLRSEAEARAQRAELARAESLVREAEQRKRRRVWLGLAATLAVGIAGLAVGLVQLNRALHDEKSARTLAEERKQLADDSKKLADENFTLALEAIKAQVFDIDLQLRNRTGTRGLREKLQKSATDRLKTLVERTSQRSAVDHTAFWARANLGDIYLRVDLRPTLARTEYEKAHAIARQMVEADPSDAQAQRDLSISCSRLGDVTLQLGQAAKALEYYSNGLEISKRQAADPSDAQAQRDLSISFNKLGDVKLQLGQAAKTLEYYSLGLEICKAQAAADPSDTQVQRDLSISYSKLGDVTLQLGQAAKALEYYSLGLGIRKKLAAGDPTDAQAQRDLSVFFNKLGDVTRQLGQAAKALEYYSHGLEICKKQATADPSDAQAQRDLSVSYDKLGNVTFQSGQVAKALEYYTQGLDIRKEQAAADPSDAQAQRDLSISFNKLGDVTRQLDQAAKALEYYSLGLDICKKLAADSSDGQIRRDLSVSYDKLGDVTLQMGQAAKALEYYNQGLDIRKKLAAADPSYVQAQTDLFVSCWKLGMVEKKLGHFTNAVAWIRNGLKVLRPLHAAGKLQREFKNGVALAEKEIAQCEFLAALFDPPIWPLMWGWPRF